MFHSSYGTFNSFNNLELGVGWKGIRGSSKASTESYQAKFKEGKFQLSCYILYKRYCHFLFLKKPKNKKCMIRTDVLKIRSVLNRWLNHGWTSGCTMVRCLNHNRTANIIIYNLYIIKIQNNYKFFKKYINKLKINNI